MLRRLPDPSRRAQQSAHRQCREMADVPHRDLQHEADQRRRAFGKPPQADVKHAESRRRQQKRRDPEFSVKRFVKQQHDRHACDNPEQQVLEKDQHRCGLPSPALWQDTQQGEFPLPQSDRRDAPRQQS